MVHCRCPWDGDKNKAERICSQTKSSKKVVVISESNGSIQALHQEIQLEIGAMIKAEKTSFSNAIP